MASFDGIKTRQGNFFQNDNLYDDSLENQIEFLNICKSIIPSIAKMIIW